MNTRGFTHIEIMIAVAILALLSAVAIPQLNGFTQRHSQLAGANTLVTELNFSRLQAINARQRTIMCPSLNPQAASPACAVANTWQQGWLIFHDQNANNRLDNGEPLLRAGTLPDGITATSGGRRRFRFLSDGTALGNTGTIRLCAAGAATGYRVVISNVGRIRSERDNGLCQ